MTKPILHLNLKRKWFDMIKSGEKKEEYRDLSTYWSGTFKPFSNKIKIAGQLHDPQNVIIRFSNGYRKDRDQFDIECIGYKLGGGKAEWGAELGVTYNVLSLGNIISST